MSCARCNTNGARPFTTANVPLCAGCESEWYRESSCRNEGIWASMGWDGNPTTATPERLKEFHEELAQRTKKWASKEKVK